MLDVLILDNADDLVFSETEAAKAGNVLSVQLGSLEYAPNFGVDLRFFLSDDFNFENESFKAYLVERLTQHQINVSQVLTTLSSFLQTNVFYVGDAINAIGLDGGTPQTENIQITSEDGFGILSEEGDQIVGG
jgi:hypothetical protein